MGLYHRFEFLRSLLMPYWLDLYVLRRIYRQNRLYETPFHTVIILSKHHHQHHTTGLCAVFVGATVNLLRLGTGVEERVPRGKGSTERGVDPTDKRQNNEGRQEGNNGSLDHDIKLSIFATVDLQAYISPSSLASYPIFISPTSAYWANGQLCVLTNTELFLICTKYPYKSEIIPQTIAKIEHKHGTPDKSLRNDDKEKYIVSTYESVNVLTLASTCKSSLDSDMIMNVPDGWNDIVGICRGSVLLSSR
jgi:hypothetical protein